MTWWSGLAGVSAFFGGAWAWVSSPKFLSGLLVGAMLLYLLHRRLRHETSVTFNLPFNLGSTTIAARHADRVAAWKLYVQLASRKAAIPFDEEHDVIVEVYDSLRTLFDATRLLLLELPPSEYAKNDGLASLMLRVMNDGVRPHLTRWQADYRRWWGEAISAPGNAGRCPQEIQREYARYGELAADLGRTNTELSKFADALLLVARGERQRSTSPRRARATAPTKTEAVAAPDNSGMLPPPPHEPIGGEPPNARTEEAQVVMTEGRGTNA